MSTESPRSTSTSSSSSGVGRGGGRVLLVSSREVADIPLAAPLEARLLRAAFAATAAASPPLLESAAPAASAAALCPEVEEVAWEDVPTEEAMAQRFASRFDVVIIRTAWNYHERLTDFMRCVSALAQHSTLLNPLPVLRWNTDKQYLHDLARHGVATLPTVYLGRSDVEGEGEETGAVSERACEAAVRRVMQQLGWRHVIVKPVVSASAFLTAQARAESPAQMRRMAAVLARVFRTHASLVMVQPYVPTIHTCGERSLVFIDGVFSHAVVKVFDRGLDVEKRDNASATFHPPPRYIEFAQRALLTACNIVTDGISATASSLSSSSSSPSSLPSTPRTPSASLASQLADAGAGRGRFPVLYARVDFVSMNAAFAARHARPAAAAWSGGVRVGSATDKQSRSVVVAEAPSPMSASAPFSPLSASTPSSSSSSSPSPSPPSPSSPLSESSDADTSDRRDSDRSESPVAAVAEADADEVATELAAFARAEADAHPAGADDDVHWLMELEMVEPWLYVETAERAATLAAAIERRVALARAC